MDSMELIGTTTEEVNPQLTLEEETETYARLIAGPLEAGYGITLGNALRRVLLSSLEGCAIVSVRVDQVEHEFSTINGMQEDTTEFLLNVKEIRLRALSNRTGTLALDAQGPGVITAGDIQVPADLEVVNPELYLCRLDTRDARLNVEFHTQLGKVYIPAGSLEGLPIGVIPVDAIFSPVRKVTTASRRPVWASPPTSTGSSWSSGPMAPSDRSRLSARAPTSSWTSSASSASWAARTPAMAAA
jgi:DNA-directed RNA polymerase subunit alpha